ncbi:MAG: hypothetical protein ACM3UU_10275 [Ignavibacteriales bacterium]
MYIKKSTLVIAIVLIIAASAACCIFCFNSGKAVIKTTPENNTLNQVNVSNIIDKPKEDLQNGKTPEAKPEEKNDWLCIPDQSVGPITAETSEEDLKAVFGSKNVLTESKFDSEGIDKITVSYIFKGTKNEVQIEWKDQKSLKGPKRIVISGQGGKWKTPEGVAVGTSLEELNKINNSTFIFSGFCWDGAGIVTDWEDGTLSKYKAFYPVLAPENISNIPDKYSGDKRILSDDKELEKLKLRVATMRIGF